VTTANCHYVGAKHRVAQDFFASTDPKYDVNHFPAFGGDFVNIGSFAVALFDICGFETVNCGQRVVLCIAGETPSTNRGTEQMHWPLQPRRQIAQYGAIELAEHQPLGTAGRARNCADRRYVESVRFYGFEGTRARFECQRDRFHKMSICWGLGKRWAAIIGNSITHLFEL
jgi:hypothetical protein